VKENGRWLIHHSGYTRLWERFEDFDKKPNLPAHLFATMDLPETHPELIQQGARNLQIKCF